MVGNGQLLDDVSPEYVAAAPRYFGKEQGQAWAAQLRGQPMARVAIRPNWVAVLDFQTRFQAPSVPRRRGHLAVADAMAEDSCR